MNEHENSKTILDASLEFTPGMPAASQSPPLRSPLSENDDPGTSPHSHPSIPTKGSLEWLKSKRECWKTSQRQKLVEYPSSEGNEIQKAQQAIDLLCAIQTGKSDASAILPAIDGTDKLKKDNQNRERLIAFYEKYNPSKLSTVDETLGKYSGQEDELFRKLEAKYAKDPYLPATGTGPKCFMEFSTGDRVTFELFQDRVPFATENFRSLCTGEAGVSYRDCIVHRIVPNFCIQAGDYTKGDGTGGRSIYPKALPANPKTDMWGNFEDETPFLRHDSPGLLSMANNGPNRNSSQFFVTLRPLPHLNGKHVVFGRVTQGMDVVEKLSRLATNDKTQRPVETLRIINCGEIGVDTTDASIKHLKTNTRNVVTPVSFASNTSTPSAFPFSSPNSSGSIFKSMLPQTSGAAGLHMNQEEIEPKESIPIAENIKLDQRSQDDLVSIKINQDLGLCAEINSCLQRLEYTGTSKFPVSTQPMVQKMEQGCRQSSHDLLPMVKGKKNCNEPFPSNPVISSNHRFKQTIAALLSEDPIGLQLMEMAKGREMALMQPIPQLHLGAITLKCVRRSSTKQLNTRMSSDVLDGPCSTNQYYLKCDPLLIPFSINTKHNETSE